jgi:hypothetical protein
MEMYAQLEKDVKVALYRLSENMGELQPFGENIMEISLGIEMLTQGMN